MPNVRRFLIVFTGCLLFGWAASGLVRAVADDPASPPPPDGLKVEIEQAGQPPREAVAAFRTLRLKMTAGTIDLDLSKVKSVVVESVEAEVVTASVEMSDHSRMHGQLLTPELPVVADGKTEKLPLTEGLKVKFLHPRQTGLVAALIGLFTLTIMEIVLGIDNIIFLAIVAGKLPEPQQPKARRIGLAAALGTRLLLLAFLSWLMGATKPLFTLPDLPFLHDPEARGVSIRDLVLLVGGLFLIGKSTKEIHEKIEHAEAGPSAPKKLASFASVIAQIAVIDIIFSLDSVITAVGMVEDLWVMVVAMLLAVAVMVVFAEPISRFVEKNPSIKLLALSFLILIGALLVAESLGQHIDKGYIYFAMAFAVVIELINMRLRPKPTDGPSSGEGI
jgi:predicted tellurium resistance membrane protein TerC